MESHCRGGAQLLLLLKLGFCPLDLVGRLGPGWPKTFVEPFLGRYGYVTHLCGVACLCFGKQDDAGWQCFDFEHVEPKGAPRRKATLSGMAFKEWMAEAGAWNLSLAEHRQCRGCSSMFVRDPGLM